MAINESGLIFTFQEGDEVKFDDTKFYRNYFSMCPNAKGIDVINDSPQRILLLEIKNCTGHEADNNWRMACNNSKVSTAPTTVDTENRESLDIEVAKKVTMTIACLIGAYTKKEGCVSASFLAPFSSILLDQKICTNRKEFLVILFLEGRFGCQTRTKKMIMKSLEDSIRKKLKWLNCLVSVVDSSSYNHNVFEIS